MQNLYKIIKFDSCNTVFIFIVLQHFSYIAEKLRHKNAPTLSSLKNIVETSYDPPPFVTFLDVVYDFKNWISNVIRPISKHSTPHVFKFKKDETGEVNMWYKRFAMDKEWILGGPILSQIPPGAPAIERKTWEKLDVKSLETQLKTCNHIMKNEEVTEWKNYLCDLVAQQR